MTFWESFAGRALTVVLIAVAAIALVALLIGLGFEFVHWLSHTQEGAG